MGQHEVVDPSETIARWLAGHVWAQQADQLHKGTNPTIMDIGGRLCHVCVCDI